MTADRFYLDIGHNDVFMTIEDGSIKTSAEVSIEDFAYALLQTNSNLAYIAKEVKDELIRRARNAWDDSMITGDNLETFQEVLEAIL